MKKLLLIASLCLLLSPALTFASIDNNLYYGLQKNSDVKQLQEFLIDKDFLTGSATGNFFSLTLKAVKAYQTSVSINPTGYVGTLTRTAINNKLATNLSASNQEATNETGTTPPTPTPPATTNDVVATLQAQIALLTQQLQAMQAQQTTTQQIAQNTQQIVQNTTPTVPTTPIPLSASCSISPNPVVQGNSATLTASASGGSGIYYFTWSNDTSRVNLSNCVGRTTNPTCSVSCFGIGCTGSGNMGTVSVQVSDTSSQTKTISCPDLIVNNSPPPPICTPNWQCSDWSVCSINTQAPTQTRTCTDSNNCNATSTPELEKPCAVSVLENPAYSNQSVTSNTKGVKIGSYVIKNQSSSNNIRLTLLSVGLTSDMPLSSVSNLHTSATTEFVNQPASSEAFGYFNNGILNYGNSITIDIYADINSSSSGTIQTTLAVSSVYATGGIPYTTTAITGQNITISPLIAQ